MDVRLVRLFRRGVRRTPDECRADPGVFGVLTVKDWPEHNAARRPLKVGRFWPRYDSFSRKEHGPPLFDVVLLRITPRGVLLGGIELSIEEGQPEPVHHEQHWWCEWPSHRPPDAAAPGANSPR